MGVEKRHSHVKFSRTIRLGKNIDLDNAVAGQVEVGSLRDNGTNVQRWNGTFWENIGAPVATKEITFADSPYSVTNSDDFLNIDTSGGSVTINLLPLATAPMKPIYIRMNDGQPNTIILDPNSSELIDGAPTLVISSDGNAEMIVPFSASWRSF